MTTGKLIGPIVVGLLLVVAGLYLRTDGSPTADFMGTAFVVIGAVSVVVNLALAAVGRRR